MHIKKCGKKLEIKLRKLGNPLFVQNSNRTEPKLLRFKYLHLNESAGRGFPPTYFGVEFSIIEKQLMC